MRLKTADLTQKELKRLLTYTPETGLFYWNFSQQQILAQIASGEALQIPWFISELDSDFESGSEAGFRLATGYACIRLYGTTFRAHRLAFLYMTGTLPSGVVDHIDRIRHNNCWENLRDVTPTQNARNRSVSVDNKSKITGVRRLRAKQGCKGKPPSFVAYITVNYKRHSLGKSGTLLGAAILRYNAEQLHGFTNFNPNSSAKLYIDKYAEL